MPSTAIRVVADGLRSPEGPVVLAGGDVAIVEAMASRISRVSLDGRVITLAIPGDAPNGMASDAVGRLLVANNGGIGHPVKSAGRLQRVSELGEVEDLATGLDAPNDVCVAGDGSVWFTDPRDNWFEAALRPGRVYRWADGELSIEHEGFEYPNGIGWAPDGSLIVAESRTGLLHRREGSNWEQWTQLPNGAPDGFAFSTDGRCFVCCFDVGTIFVLDPNGHVNDALMLGADTMPTNCAIGPQGDLFVTDSGSGRLLAISLGLEPAPVLGPAN